MTLPPFLKSRKFWALLVGAGIIILRNYVPNFPLSDQQVTDVALLFIAYILGTGLEDAGANGAARRMLEAIKSR
jgi:hypothetical protein